MFSLKENNSLCLIWKKNVHKFSVDTYAVWAGTDLIIWPMGGSLIGLALVIVYYSDTIPFLLLLHLLLLSLLLLLTFILIVIIVILFFFSRNFDFLIPDAPELVHTFLEQEQDASCKRNAFMMLIHVDQVIGQYSGVSYKAYIFF